MSENANPGVEGSGRSRYLGVNAHPLTVEHDGETARITILAESLPARSLPDLIVRSADVDCLHCRGFGLVCESHPDRPWDAGSVDDCDCGGAGQPCACSGLGPS